MDLNKDAIKIAAVGAVGLGIFLLSRKSGEGETPSGAYSTLVGTGTSAGLSEAAYEMQRAAMEANATLAGQSLTAQVEMARIGADAYGQRLAAQVASEANRTAAEVDAYKAWLGSRKSASGAIIDLSSGPYAGIPSYTPRESATVQPTVTPQEVASAPTYTGPTLSAPTMTPTPAPVTTRSIPIYTEVSPRNYQVRERMTV